VIDLIDRISGLFLQGQQPWWVYALIVFIPFCVTLCFREAFCWFWKINKLISRLERLDTRLNSLHGAISRLQAAQAALQEPIVDAPPSREFTLVSEPSKGYKLK
jgi:hypothetical protein